MSIGGAGIGYQLAGEEGAYAGGLAGAAAGRRINVGSGSGGGSMTMTQERAPVERERRRPIVPPTNGPKTIIGKLGSALQNIQPDTRPPVQQKIKESEYLKNVEEELGQAARSDLSRVQRSTKKAKEPSMLSKVSDSIKSAYRRLSGGEGDSKGTYAILPTEEPKTKTRKLGVSADAPKSWPAMEKAKVRNEKIIRESIEKTNQAEIAKALQQGIIVPQELISKAKLDFSNKLIENRKQSASTLHRVSASTLHNVTVEPIPQDKPEEPNKELVTDVMGFDPKFDGLKMKNKTMPWSKVAKGAAMGTLGAATVIVAGKDIYLMRCQSVGQESDIN